MLKNATPNQDSARIKKSSACRAANHETATITQVNTNSFTLPARVVQQLIGGKPESLISMASQA